MFVLLLLQLANENDGRGHIDGDISSMTEVEQHQLEVTDGKTACICLKFVSVIICLRLYPAVLGHVLYLVVFCCTILFPSQCIYVVPCGFVLPYCTIHIIACWIVYCSSELCCTLLCLVELICTVLVPYLCLALAYCIH